MGQETRGRQARLFETIGSPPIQRRTRSIETVSEDKLPEYLRRKIAYTVGEDDRIHAYLLIPHTIKTPSPAIVAMHQTVNCGKDEVAALIPPRPWLNISSYDDMAYGNQEFLAETGVLLYQVYKLFGKQNAFSYLMHGNDHSFPKYACDLAYDWRDRFLLSGENHTTRSIH